MAYRVESFLSARLHLAPQLVGDRIFFVSNLSGKLSLYAMHYGGSVPEPLLPPDLALQNPHLVGGYLFYVFPLLDKILVMLDRDGDENYQPMLIPIDGGYPEPAFDNYFAGYRVHLLECEPEKNLAYFSAERRDRSLHETYRGDLRTGRLEKLDESEWGAYPSAPDSNHRRLFLVDGYTVGDSVLYLWENGSKTLLLGKPLEQRAEGEVVPLNGLQSINWTPSETNVLISSALFEDTYSPGLISLERPNHVEPVKVEGVQHRGVGELEGIRHLKGARYAVQFNIDGCSWLYEAVLNEEKRLLSLRHVLVGEGDLADGVLADWHYDKSKDRFVISFSTATSPTQIYTIEGKERDVIVMHTEERILGIPESLLSKGEDASFISFDGTRISARLYLPSPELGLSGPRPLVYYIHGGPQSQERPDFAWFSMPLIQFLTLRGFAVFVPNVRGSTGYGLSYTKQVDRDWGGKDRLDHVHAMTKVLPKDARLDVSRAAVVGRSYGGYMTLMLVGRHPELWKAACDMFGPYDLLTFSERIPETWKPYFKIALGDPATPEGRAFLTERSPKTYLASLACPLLVIQGRNDPRVVARESEDLVADLRAKGKQVELLIFEDEGHDVLKYANRVMCYNAITEFFVKTLLP
ncbi:MAG: prolyl oligopeptidase family serine peptidase [Anaerolineales bacterium]|nr:prolyl oligopeptidase family serine peptidase [Anaerolineales bacterium]MCX7609646.1 prolyl oligopeptidase family serine peptidase [Anaerolineales bacterium]MDW8228152.1 prolyl oligopeptidase family serine peptidase [Anaerolineales bacterium]